MPQSKTLCREHRLRANRFPSTASNLGARSGPKRELPAVVALQVDMDHLEPGVLARQINVSGSETKRRSIVDAISSRRKNDEKHATGMSRIRYARSTVDLRSICGRSTYNPWSLRERNAAVSYRLDIGTRSRCEHRVGARSPKEEETWTLPGALWPSATMRVKQRHRGWSSRISRWRRPVGPIPRPRPVPCRHPESE